MRGLQTGFTYLKTSHNVMSKWQVLVRDIQFLTRIDQAGIWTDGSNIRIVNSVDVACRHIAVEVVGDLAQVIARSYGVAGSARFHTSADVHVQSPFYCFH